MVSEIHIQFMDATVFIHAVQKVTILPKMLIERLTSIADQIKPEGREAIVKELEGAEQREAEIVQHGLAEVSSIERNVNREVRVTQESTERKEEESSLQNFGPFPIQGS